MLDIRRWTLGRRVALGVQLLDQAQPDWRSRINPASLNISDIASCVLAQLGGGSYRAGRRALGLSEDDTPEYGFEVPYGTGEGVEPMYRALKQLWRHAIAQ